MIEPVKGGKVYMLNCLKMQDEEEAHKNVCKI